MLAPSQDQEVQITLFSLGPKLNGMFVGEQAPFCAGLFPYPLDAITTLVSYR
jgi:hypothetical protein